MPDFVQADHPVFVDFVKDYFKFLEGLVNFLLLVRLIILFKKLKQLLYILDEQDGDRIVTEICIWFWCKVCQR